MIKYEKFPDTGPSAVWSLTGPGVASTDGSPPAWERANWLRDMLINNRQYPKLEHELTHVRLQKPNSPSGYNRGDVKRMRKLLKLASDTPFIVGHTPCSTDDTLWENAGEISNHHVLFSSHPEWVGVIAQVNGNLLPLRYPTESLMDLFNHLTT